MRKLLALVLVLATSVVCADATTAAIQNNLKTTLPELKVDQINPTAVKNVYEVISGHKVFYVDGSGRYAFLGNMVDLNTKKSITQTKVEQLSVVNWNELPLNIAIKQVIGKGERRIAVFTDPDCPFCQRLEQDTIPKLKNVTVYYFLFPLAIHANAENDSKRILCAENPDATFKAWMVSSIALPARNSCKNSANLPIMKALGNKFGIDAAPTIILPNGKLLPGLAPADYLNKLINDTAPAKIAPPAIPALPSAMESSIAPSQVAGVGAEQAVESMDASQVRNK